LICEHEHSFQREFTLAVVKQVFKGWAQQVNDHDVVVTLDTEPVDVRDTDSTLENTVELGFVEELGVLRAHRFEFNCNFLISADVGSMVDITEGAAAELARQSVLSADSQFHFYFLSFVSAQKFSLFPGSMLSIR